MKHKIIPNVQVVNQVSYEFSRTELAQYITSPQLVRDIDWIDIVWPQRYRKQRTATDENIITNYYPAIQYYCLTSGAGSYMDFHVDFGGTSVWYHIVAGQKELCLIEPTIENLITYENWICNKDNKRIFLPDNMNDPSKIIRVILNTNETMIVPSGWIHAVYTPADSVVYGGNFLHGYDIRLQIIVNGIEIRRQVLEKYRCPFFPITLIYAAGMYLQKMMIQHSTGQQQQQTIITLREIKEIPYLVQEIRKLWRRIPNTKRQKPPNNICTNDKDDDDVKIKKPTFVSAAWEVTIKNNCSTVEEFFTLLEQEQQRIEKVLKT
jgi:F-box/leucine-rich repeat protein 10/11